MVEMRIMSSQDMEMDRVASEGLNNTYPFYERMKGRLLIKKGLVVGLAVSTIRVPYNESMGSTIAIVPLCG
jgi:hypothetical protein